MWMKCVGKRGKKNEQKMQKGDEQNCSYFSSTALTRVHHRQLKLPTRAGSLSSWTVQRGFHRRRTICHRGGLAPSACFVQCTVSHYRTPRQERVHQGGEFASCASFVRVLPSWLPSATSRANKAPDGARGFRARGFPLTGHNSQFLFPLRRWLPRFSLRFSAAIVR